MHIGQARLEMQGQSLLVADAVLEGVPAQVAAGVLFSAESPESIFVSAVDGRTGETKKKSIGKAARIFRPTLPSGCGALRPPSK